MLLWLSRVCRPDTSHAAGALGSRLTTWSAVCEEELERCVSYVEATADIALTMVMRLADGHACEKVETYVDANWELPRSCSGYIAGAASGAGS